MKKIFKIAILAASISAPAFADWDVEFAGSASAYSFDRSVTTTDNSQSPAVNTIVSKSGFLQDFGARISANYLVAEDVYVGISTGVQYDLEFAGDVSKQIGTASASEGAVLDEDKKGSSYLTIPVKANIKYDIAEVADNTNIYFTIRPGFSYSMDITSNAPTGYQASPFGFLIDAGLGVEFYGAQLEAFYAGQFLSGYSQEVANSDPVKYNTKAYSNHGICVSLGYRLKDII